MDKLSSWLFWINVGNSFAVRFTFNEALYTESTDDPDVVCVTQ